MGPEDTRPEGNDPSSSSISSYTMDATAEPGSPSPRCHHPPPWAEVPVSYVPDTWPTGPRELPPGCFVCPFEGCKNPVGQTASGQGYTRKNLAAHMPSHGGLDGLRSLRREIRWRVKFLRQALRQKEDDDDYHFQINSDERDENLLLQWQARAIIYDLEEIKAWEVSCRHMRPSGPAEEARAARQESRSSVASSSRPRSMSRTRRENAHEDPEQNGTSYQGPTSQEIFAQRDRVMHATRRLPPLYLARKLETSITGRETSPKPEDESPPQQNPLGALEKSLDVYDSTRGIPTSGESNESEDTEDDGDVESLPNHNSNRPQDDLSRLSKMLFSGSIAVPSSSQAVAKDAGSSREPPRKKARMSGPELDGSGEGAD